MKSPSQGQAFLDAIIIMVALGFFSILAFNPGTGFLLRTSTSVIKPAVHRDNHVLTGLRDRVANPLKTDAPGPMRLTRQESGEAGPAALPQEDHETGPTMQSRIWDKGPIPPETVHESATDAG
jgi:hypothetical protein